MKAAVYDTFEGPIRVKDISIPNVPIDGVLVQVKASGVCRSDWHAWKGHDDDVRQHGLPFVPGHEFSGIVVRVGNTVNKYQVGDRVAVPFILSCGSCHYCQKNRPTICQKQRQPGFTYWGSFAEFVAVPRADWNIQRIPDAVSFLQAAALGCRFTTAYRALVHQGRLCQGETIAIFGCGGVGLSCIMIAKGLQAAQIIAVDISPAALAKAKELGATHTILMGDDIQSDVYKLTPQHDGVDVAVDAAGFPATCEGAVYCTRRGGRMVQVGLPIGEVPPKIPMGRVVGLELQIIGSHGFSANELKGMLEMVARGLVHPERLVENQVDLETGARQLQDMDHSSPLGITVITKFDENPHAKI